MIEDPSIPAARLETLNVSKTFGESRVLHDVHLEVAPGEVHCLLGQNGSGKSTLVKILSGYQAPDRGSRIRMEGEDLRLPLRPAALRAHGIAVVHQDLGLADAFSVLENISVGSRHAMPLSRRIDRAQERRAARNVLDRLGQQLDLDSPTGRLTAADRVSVAMARALLHLQAGRGLVMFDESTRALPPDGLAHFYDLVRTLCGEGDSVLIVTHNLAEALALGDRVSVLRDGRLVVSGQRTDGLTEPDLVRLVLGRALHEQPAPASARGDTGVAISSRPTAVRIRGVRLRRDGRDALRGVELDIAAGEILGVIGRIGSGAEDLPNLLAGQIPSGAVAEGSVQVSDTSIDLARLKNSETRAAQIALVPENRERDGVAFDLSLQDNLALPQLTSRSSRLYLPTRWQRDLAERTIEQLDIRPPIPEAPMRSFSGGNQQKVLLGKWLATQPRLLVLHEPTQGVDVGARADIQRALRHAAANGAALLYVAGDASELVDICDRLAIMEDGRITQLLAAPFDLDQVLTAVYSAPEPCNDHDAERRTTR